MAVLRAAQLPPQLWLQAPYLLLLLVAAASCLAQAEQTTPFGIHRTVQPLGLPRSSSVPVAGRPRPQPRGIDPYPYLYGGSQGRPVPASPDPLSGYTWNISGLGATAASYQVVHHKAHSSCTHCFRLTSIFHRHACTVAQMIHPHSS